MRGIIRAKADEEPMADNKPGGRRGSNPVKPPTIDLKAEKVKEAVVSDAPKLDETSAKTGKAEKPAAPQDAKPASADSQEKPKPSAERERAKPAAASPDSGQAVKFAGYAGAGALGAVVALAVGYGASLFGSSPPAATVPPELTARLDALEQQLALNAGKDDPAALEELRSTLDAAQKAAAAERESLRQDVAGMKAAAGDLKTRLDAMAASGVDGASVEAIAGIEAAIAALKDDVAALKAAQPDGSAERLDGLDAKVTDLESRMSALSERVASAASGSGGGAGSAEAAQVLALTDLRDAISRGGAFADELDALRALVPGEPVLGELDGAAATGVATRRGLEMEFSQKLPEILSAVNMRSDAGILARLFDNARGIITVRPVGAIDGDSPEAIVARIEAKLADGDLAGALADWQALPQPAQEAAGDWGTALAGKVRVDAAINEFSRSVISDLKNAS
ncbi:MAG: hypothetical protein KDJ62_12270 [Rhodobiaceae bacterium]|nr:hypothetical protein [Rhodobiaceae bacterium]